MILGFTSAAAWIIFLNFEQIMKWWWSCYWQRRLVCRTLEKEVGAASQPHLVIKHLSSSSSSPSHLSSPPSPSKDMAGLRLTGLEKGGDHSESCVVRFSNWLRSVGWGTWLGSCGTDWNKSIKVAACPPFFFDSELQRSSKVCFLSILLFSQCSKRVKRDSIPNTCLMIKTKYRFCIWSRFVKRSNCVVGMAGWQGWPITRSGLIVNARMSEKDEN